MDLLNMPVTLVVKAPNQKVADQTVECALDWTIMKLKRHLSDVYPSKPGEHQQKLIYSGKLLHDHLKLQDVLRKFEDHQTTHTVHLVCAGATEAQPSPASVPSQTSPEPAPVGVTSSASSTQETSHTAAPANHTAGVRHRHSPGTPQEAFQQYYGGNNGGMYMGYYPGMMPYSPEQFMMMQQMYAAQMAQFMQLYQQGPVFGPQGTPLLNGETLNAIPPAANQNAEQPADQRRADPQMVMNAQGGMAFDDDEEEGNRDWLDSIYTMCRLAVLLSIVYFYSTFGRFMLVFGFFFLVYLYQGGYFRLRRNGRQQGAEQQPAPPAAQQAQPQEPEPQPEEVRNVGAAAEERGGSEGQETESDTPPAEAVAPRSPGVFAFVWSFVSTFFSSLIPQQPPGVNAN